MLVILSCHEISQMTIMLKKKILLASICYITCICFLLFFVVSFNFQINIEGQKYKDMRIDNRKYSRHMTKFCDV